MTLTLQCDDKLGNGDCACIDEVDHFDFSKTQYI